MKNLIIFKPCTSLAVYAGQNRGLKPLKEKRKEGLYAVKA